jgi:hypothetical protein
MVMKGIDLSLEVCVIVKKGWVIVPGILKLLSQLHNLVFSHSDLSLIVLNESGELSISHVFLVDSSLDISILLSVAFIEGTQMFELLLVASLLRFKFH